MVMERIEVISRSPRETGALGERWGQEARAGWVIGLSGELGAGKTQLVKGLARGLGIERRVQSPTFALVHEYQEGRLPLFHLDLYRLDHREQVMAAGLDQYLSQEKGVVVVEWIERWSGGELPTAANREPWMSRYRQVRILSLPGEERRIVYEDFGG